MDSHGRSPNGFSLLDIENGKTVSEMYKHYDNLFRAYYNEKPEFDDKNIATVLNDCVGLIDVADNVGSIHVISESVDIALLRQGQVLFRSIAANATAWADLAFRVRSPTIFKEAMVHLVGQWNLLSQADRDGLKPEVLNLCQRKHEELKLMKQAVEIRILGHYPVVVQRQQTSTPGRMSYSNDIYMWMVLSLFRQWFSQSICEQRNYLCRDGGATLYRQIGEGGYTYLDRKTLEGFHSYFPMSHKGMCVLENHLSVYKQELKPFVSGLLTHRSQLDITKDTLPYLTCCVVENSDLPWKKDQAGNSAARGKVLSRKRRFEASAADDDDEEILANMSKAARYGDNDNLKESPQV